MCVGSGSRLILSMRFNTLSISQMLYGAEAMLAGAWGPTKMIILNNMEL